jgi:DNA-binding response OmpR family regulator
MTSSKGRILCTEDDADTRDLLIHTLTIAGYDVSCTDSAHTAIDRLKSEKFDLCVMDNWMPGTSGEDLCKKIREFDDTTPVLFYSGAAYPADKERARAAGAQGYLVKPVMADQLLAEVGRIISESRLTARQ